MVTHLEVHGLGDHLGDVADGDLLLLAHRQDDRVDTGIVAEGPHGQRREVARVDELPQGLPAAPDREVGARLLRQVALQATRHEEDGGVCDGGGGSSGGGLTTELRV